MKLPITNFQGRTVLLVSGRVFFVAEVPTLSMAGIFDFGERDSSKQTPERDSWFLSFWREARETYSERDA